MTPTQHPAQQGGARQNLSCQPGKAPTPRGVTSGSLTSSLSRSYCQPHPRPLGLSRPIHSWDSTSDITCPRPLDTNFNRFLQGHCLCPLGAESCLATPSTSPQAQQSTPPCLDPIAHSFSTGCGEGGTPQETCSSVCRHSWLSQLEGGGGRCFRHPVGGGQGCR